MNKEGKEVALVAVVAMMSTQEIQWLRGSILLETDLLELPISKIFCDPCTDTMLAT